MKSLLQLLATDQPVDGTRLRKAQWRLSLALLLLIGLTYANSFPGAFIQDDLHIVQNNPLVKSFDPLLIFTTDYWYGVDNSGLYRPMTILSLCLNRMITGIEPWGFHLVNLLLHGACTILIWLCMPRWGFSLRVAFLAALLFAVHPIHTEVLNEAVGRSEFLVALFVLLALFAARSNQRWATPVILTSFTLALLSKEHGIVLLGLLPLFEVCHVGGFSVWRKRWPLYLAMAGLVLLWLLFRQFGVVQVGVRGPYSTTAVPLAYIPWDERFLTALQYQWVYLFKLLWPVELHAVYSLPDLPAAINRWWSLPALLVLLATGVVILVGCYGLVRKSSWFMPMGAYVICFAPTANILFPIGVTMAERLAYLPSVWFCLGMAVGGEQALRIWANHRRVVLTLFLGCLLLFATRTVVRNRDFVSEIALWQREIKVNPADFLGWQSYAESLNNSRRYDEAEQAYRQVMQMQPDFQGARRSYFVFLFKKQRYDEAIALETGTLKLARAQGDAAGAAYDLVNLAMVHVELKEYRAALDALNGPEVAYFDKQDFVNSLAGRAWQGLGDHGKAIHFFAEVKDYTLDQNVPLYAAISLFALGKAEEAHKRVREAIRVNERPEAWNLLGTILAQKYDYAAAVEAFSRAVQLAPDQRHYQENLARARSMLP